jgi:hypothetical protein
MAEQVFPLKSALSGAATSQFGALLLLVGAGFTLTGCVTMPTPDFAGATHAAHQRADQVSNAAEDRMPGVNDAVQAPLRDLNMVDDEIPTILVRAYQHPYDMRGLDSCPSILDQVTALDLALGPDVDIPRSPSARDDMLDKGRGLAGAAALDAVRSATTGVIPVRSWVRRLSGANRAEQEAKAIALAGSVRRGFLKAMGIQRGCDWPAAPLDLKKVALKHRDLSPAEQTAIGDTPKQVVAGGVGPPAGAGPTTNRR